MSLDWNLNFWLKEQVILEFDRKGRKMKRQNRLGGRIMQKISSGEDILEVDRN